MMIWRVFFKEKKEKRCPFLFFRDVLDLVFVVFVVFEKSAVSNVILFSQHNIP